MNLNKSFILGRLTADPDNKVLPSGQPVTNFSVATNCVWTGQDGNKKEDTQYHNIVVFGKLADIASRYLAKGRLVLVEGRTQTRSWEGADGARKYKTEIIAENIQLGPRPAGDRESDTQDAPKTDVAANKKTDTKPKDSKEEIPIIDQDDEVDTSDIPF